MLAVNRACVAWEPQAGIEAASFEAVVASLEGVQCSPGSQEGAYTIVICTGRLLADYGGDLQAFEIGARDYLAIPEDGEWKMCGYR